MRTKYFLTLILGVLISVAAQAQDFSTTVCSGAVGTYEVASPQVGSTYTWTLKNGAGTLSASTGASIRITWDGTQNADVVSVTETNAGGCTGPATTIAVARYAQPTAVFANANLCNGTAPTVNLTGTPPYTLTWIDPTAPFTQSNFGIANNTFTLSASQVGNYKLISIGDKNCLVNIATGAAGSTAVVSAPLSKLTITIK